MFIDNIKFESRNQNPSERRSQSENTHDVPYVNPCHVYSVHIVASTFLQLLSLIGWTYIICHTGARGTEYPLPPKLAFCLQIHFQ